MQRLLSVRITKWPIKLAYVVVAYAIGIPFVWLISNVYLGSAINLVLTLGTVWYGARVFRGRGEPVTPARPWWRMTAWRRASGWIGAVCVLGVLAGPYLVISPGRLADRPVTAFDVLQLSVPYAILAFFYLNSWARLRAVPTPPKPARERRALSRPKSTLS